MALGPLAEEVVINRKLQGVDFLFKPLVSRCGDHHGRRVKAQHVRKRHRREHGESARGEKFFCLGTACAGLKKDDSLVVTFAGSWRFRNTKARNGDLLSCSPAAARVAHTASKPLLLRTLCLQLNRRRQHISSQRTRRSTLSELPIISKDAMSGTSCSSARRPSRRPASKGKRSNRANRREL